MPYYPTTDMFQTTAIIGLWIVSAGLLLTILTML